MEKEYVALKQQLDKKFQQLKYLEQTIIEQQLELEMQIRVNTWLLQSLQTSQHKLERITDKKVVEKKIEQWQKVKDLVNQLFEEGSDITQIKLAMVNVIKHTGMR